jgi:hypothetical protein
MTKCHFAGLLILLAAAVWDGAAAQNAGGGPTAAMGEFDCVMEPKMTIKLASPEAGVIPTRAPGLSAGTRL